MKKECSILIVDDDPECAAILESTLTLSGYRTRVAHSGAEARKAVAKEVPHTILMDICLPDCYGTDLSRELKSQHSEIHVICITGKHLTDMINLLQYECEGYLLKPIQPGKLIDTVNKLTGRCYVG